MNRIARIGIPAQAAFWLVDGHYQVFEQELTQLDLVLRVERVRRSADCRPRNRLTCNWINRIQAHQDLLAAPFGVAFWL